MMLLLLLYGGLVMVKMVLSSQRGRLLVMYGKLID